MRSRPLFLGVALAISAPHARADEPPAAAPEPARDAAQARENRVRMIEARISADESALDENRDKLSWLRKLKVTGYVQGQLVMQRFNEAASPNLVDGRLPAGIGANAVVAKADGTTTNSTLFRVRRARIKVDFAPTEYARFVLEFDPVPAGGPAAGVGSYARTVEAIGRARWSNEAQTDFGAGIFKVPFGYEIPNENSAERIFVERSWGSDNMFPGIRDVGIRATTVGFEKKLEFTAAVLNGVLQGEKTFVGVPDLNRAKEMTGRLTYDFGRFKLGMSGYWGKGQLIDGPLLRFKQYNRAGFDFELTARRELFKELGSTFAHLELMVGQNMDRGTRYPFALPAIPANVSDKVTDRDQFSFLARLEQDLSELVTLGVRYDYYSPDTAQAGNARHTLAFAGAVNFTKGLSLKNEGDYAFDSVRPGGQPDPKREIATFSTMLQGRF